MAAIPLKVRGLNVVLVVFSLLVLGGSAAFISQNTQVNTKVGASNVVQNISGVLLKKGTAAFNRACSGVTTTYAILGSTSPTPNPNQRGIGLVIPKCTALNVLNRLADPLVGKGVIATGTLQNNIFYATKLVASIPVKPTPTPPGRQPF